MGEYNKIERTPEELRENMLNVINNGGKMVKALDSLGINDEYLADKLHDELDAKETKVFQYKGATIQKDDLVAWEIRQRARQDAHKLRGDYPSEKHHVTVEGGLPVTQLSEEDRLEIEARKQVLKEKALRKDAKK